MAVIESPTAMLLRTLAGDRQLRAESLRIYLFILADLDRMEYLPVKQAYVCQRLQVHQPHVSRGLKQLVERGYLERGPVSAGRNTYRLCF